MLIAGRYETSDVLGEGSFGIVYAGRDKETGRKGKKNQDMYFAVY